MASSASGQALRGPGISPLAAAAAEFDSAAGVGSPSAAAMQSRWMSPLHEGRAASGAPSADAQVYYAGSGSPQRANPAAGADSMLTVLLEASGGVARLQYDPLALVGDLKRQLQQTHGLDAERVQLWRPDPASGEWAELPTHRLLEHEGVRGGATLRLTLGPALPPLPPAPSTRTVIQRQQPLAVADASPGAFASISPPARQPPDVAPSPATAASPAPLQQQQQRHEAAAAVDAQFGATPAPQSASQPISPARTSGPAARSPGEAEAQDAAAAAAAAASSRAAGQDTLWYLNRGMYWFLAAFALVSGFSLLMVHGAERDRDCKEAVESWTLACGLLHFLSGLAMLACACFLWHGDRCASFDNSGMQCAAGLCVLQVLLTVAFAAAGLAVVTSGTSREERDNCGPFRDTVIFIGVAAGTVVAVIAIALCTRVTWQASVEAHREERRREKVAHVKQLWELERQRKALSQGPSDGGVIEAPYVSMRP
eukprot:TRINITY_DN8319_c2_g1_i1.p1 TRINITY_DN8319_c2_g1~~TRINITY_DN8319_c2_g1_i1.p1  ORF type:complete len:484 (+),score=133.23 TRINITY_DN8319_c2_g1_i1:82-1533(+)